jgi:hypothetical protein
MSSQSDAKTLQDAIDSGIDAYTQIEKLNQDAVNCYEAADKINDLRGKVDAFARCQAIAAKANFLLEHADDINAAQGRPTAASAEVDARQSASDKAYGDTYDHYKDKSEAEIDAAYDQVAGQDNTPSKRPTLTALRDLKQHRGYHPPKVPRSPPPPPVRRRKPEPDEQPDIGGGGDDGGDGGDGGDDPQMSVSGMRRRTVGGTYPRRVVDNLMPLASYWLVETRAEPTLHFTDECPACATSGVEQQDLDAAEHPLALAERLDAHPCGTCMRMAESGLKEGFLFGTVTPNKSLAVWHDRVEYDALAWFGLSRTHVTVSPGDITEVRFGSPTELTFLTADGRFDFAFDRAAEGEIAREAFRRLGWSFDDD